VHNAKLARVKPIRTHFFFSLRPPFTLAISYTEIWNSNRAIFIVNGRTRSTFFCTYLLTFRRLRELRVLFYALFSLSAIVQSIRFFVGNSSRGFNVSIRFGDRRSFDRSNRVVAVVLRDSLKRINRARTLPSDGGYTL